jgi:hypothetical protein
MTGNTFHPEIVARIIELIIQGEINPRGTIRRGFPELTRIGVDRVVDIAWRQVAEHTGGGRPA